MRETDKKIFVAYKLTGSDKAELQSQLESITDVIHALGYQTFVFWRDVQNWEHSTNLSPKEIITRALEELRKCDILLALVANSEGSEGMQLEIGAALALNMKLVLAIQKDLEEKFMRYTRSQADKTIVYSDESDLLSKLSDLALE